MGKFQREQKPTRDKGQQQLQPDGFPETLGQTVPQGPAVDIGRRWLKTCVHAIQGQEAESCPAHPLCT